MQYDLNCVESAVKLPSNLCFAFDRFKLSWCMSIEVMFRWCLYRQLVQGHISCHTAISTVLLMVSTSLS